MRGYNKYGHSRAVRVVEPVDQMEISRPATRCADGQLSCDGCFTGCRKGCGFFMTPLLPCARCAPATRGGDSINALDSGAFERLDDQVRHGKRHGPSFHTSTAS